jgi:hypothetical protein
MQGLSGLIIWTARDHMTRYPSASIMDGECITVIIQLTLVSYVGQVCACPLHACHGLIKEGVNEI